MRYFYIDTENRNYATWWHALTKLKSTDVVYLLYTKNSSHIPLDAIPRIVETKAKFRMVEAQNGTPNALDFVLVSVVAQRVLTSPKSAHVIISMDKGYSSAIKYLCSQGYNVQIADQITTYLRQENAK